MATRKPLSDPELEASIRRAAEDLRMRYPALFAGSEPLSPEEVAAANQEDEQAYATLDRIWQEGATADAANASDAADAVNETRNSFYDAADYGKIEK